MQIGIDHGAGERTVLAVQAARKGASARAIALQSALREMGREASIGFCLHTVKTGDPITLEELPKVDAKEQGDA